MPIPAATFQELCQGLKDAATVAGLRFLKGDIKSGTKHTPSGWHDAWFDFGIPGYFKLNCFFAVPTDVYDQVKSTPWSPPSGKNCSKPPAYNRAKGGMDKGMNGTVICNGNATPASELITAVIGTDLKNEHFETALYENRLYKPPQLNLEFKLKESPRTDTPLGQTFAINAHIEPK
jgi:hypothetical protein